MGSASSYRLQGLEPDNLLAFLALLGLMRSLEHEDRGRVPPDRLDARAAWDLDTLPIRPRILLRRETDREELLHRAVAGIDALAAFHDFAGRKGLDYSRSEAREILHQYGSSSSVADRTAADLLAALTSDGAIKDEKTEAIDPTPLCLMFGQGHQHFLQRLAEVPTDPAPKPRGRGRKLLSAEECLAEALFEPWHRSDDAFSFRWDPEEDVRYALMAGDPTDRVYKPGTQHGANRLAAVGFPSLTGLPTRRWGRVRLAVIGGELDREFSFAWPIWRDPATLAAIRSLLAHPDLRRPGALRHLSVEHVMVTRRISVGKFMNFTRARPLTSAATG